MLYAFALMAILPEEAGVPVQVVEAKIALPLAVLFVSLIVRSARPVIFPIESILKTVVVAVAEEEAIAKRGVVAFETPLIES